VKNILIIVANPKKDSFSFAMANRYKEAMLKKNHQFEYVNSRPKGLLKNKTVKIFTTTGAPYFIYMLTGAHRRLKNMLKEQIVEFCGMKLEKFNIFGEVDKNSKNTEKILDKIH